MKKVFIAFGLVVGIAMIPIGVYAASELRNTVNIYNIDLTEATRGSVSTFDDSGNKCYIARIQGGASISCVRMK